jgi:hypothetical protein
MAQRELGEVTAATNDLQVALRTAQDLIATYTDESYAQFRQRCRNLVAKIQETVAQQAPS